ncbi:MULTISPECIES: hypothetical protein [unclassified Lysinibacillus]|uniref:hypothetical protein n=1 Tax=unclassified Lysinibacillus TaxID=2636778 RepID=UPI002556F672|nr:MULTISPECIES: hypothetical protein [unclassified Lysinibacillus]MDM5246594.1 hypothetical protein [Lysinibacillus sp. G4S2]
MGREPRLFIKSPTYFLNISKMLHELDLNESTSVYVKDGYFNEQTIEEKEEEQIDPYLLKQLQFLEKPFRQKAYQPLVISLKDGRNLRGTASEVQTDSLMLTSLELKSQEIIYFEDIKQILWRGKQLPTL